LGFGVWGSRFRDNDSELKVQVSGFRVQGSGSRVQGSRLMVQGSRFRVCVFGFRIESLITYQDVGWHVKPNSIPEEVAFFVGTADAEWFRSGLVFEAHRLLYHSA